MTCHMYRTTYKTTPMLTLMCMLCGMWMPQGKPHETRATNFEGSKLAKIVFTPHYFHRKWGGNLIVYLTRNITPFTPYFTNKIDPKFLGKGI